MGFGPAGTTTCRIFQVQCPIGYIEDMTAPVARFTGAVVPPKAPSVWGDLRIVWRVFGWPKPQVVIKGIGNILWLSQAGFHSTAAADPRVNLGDIAYSARLN